MKLIQKGEIGKGKRRFDAKIGQKSTSLLYLIDVIHFIWIIFISFATRIICI